MTPAEEVAWRRSRRVENALLDGAFFVGILAVLVTVYIVVHGG